MILVDRLGKDIYGCLDLVQRTGTCVRLVGEELDGGARATDYLEAGTELAVAGAGDGAGRPAAGGMELDTPAKDGARSCRRYVGRKRARYL